MTNRDADKRTSSKDVLNQVAGQQIKEIRLKLRLSQEELAELLSDDGANIYPKTIYLWETGKSKVPAWVLVKMQIIARELSNSESSRELSEVSITGLKDMINAIVKKAQDYLKG